MATVRTALSLPQPLLADAESLARELGTSRSQVFVIALVDYLERRKSRQMLQQLNAVYDQPETPWEIALLRRWRTSHRNLLRNDS